MKDYYKILGTDSESNQAEIKKAFRKQARVFHPDIAGTGGASEEKFLKVFEAYEFLSNPETREEYDRVYRYVFKKPESFSYRDFLESRKDDMESMAKLICFDLLHDNDKKAAALYDDLLNSSVFNMKKHLDREDFMDYSFLLAEEYLKQNCHLKAYYLLKEIFLLEKELPYFKHFFIEVIERFRLIGGKKIPNDSEGQIRLMILNELVLLDFENKDKAFFYKNIAEIHLGNEEISKVKYYFNLALELDPKISGANRIHKRIGKTGRSV